MGDRNYQTFLVVVVDYFLHNFQPGVVIYEEISVIGFTVPNVDTTIDIQQRIDRNVQN